MASWGCKGLRCTGSDWGGLEGDWKGGRNKVATSLRRNLRGASCSTLVAHGFCADNVHLFSPKSLMEPRRCPGAHRLDQSPCATCVIPVSVENTCTFYLSLGHATQLQSSARFGALKADCPTCLLLRRSACFFSQTPVSRRIPQNRVASRSFVITAPLSLLAQKLSMLRRSWTDLREGK